MAEDALESLGGATQNQVKDKRGLFARVMSNDVKESVLAADSRRDLELLPSGSLNKNCEF